MSAPPESHAAVTAGPGRIVIMRAPGRGAALDDDLASIGRLGPALLVSFTTADEMAALGITGLPGRLAAQGIAHTHAPIDDFGVPDAAFADAWPALSGRIHALLDRGGTIVLHCRAGLGRSGMVAARLLVERGIDPARAVARVRAARPGAIETEAQAGWVASGETRPARPGGAGSSPAGSGSRAQRT